MSKILVPLPDNATDEQIAKAKAQVRTLLDAGNSPAAVQRFVDLMAPLTEPRPMPTALRYRRGRKST